MSKISTQGLCKRYILLFRRLYRRHTNCDQPTTIPLIPVGSNLARNLYVLSLSRRTTVVQVPSFRNCLALRAVTCPRSLVLQNRISSSTASRPSCSVSAGLSDLFVSFVPECWLARYYFYGYALRAARSHSAEIRTTLMVFMLLPEGVVWVLSLFWSFSASLVTH